MSGAHCSERSPQADLPAGACRHDQAGPMTATPRLTRRRFLQLAGAGLGWLALDTRPASAAAYRVGVGHTPDPYTATQRAVAASGEWPDAAIANHPVIIKPNLVTPATADTGITTDPQVVRALVDLALASGASQVLIVESGVNGANFSACGYDFFDSYDPGGRVALVSLNDEPVVQTPVPNGNLAYTALYMPALLLDDDVVFISAAKLKCHFHTHATLSVKNLMGLAPADHYSVPPEEWRFAMHRRGINQAIVDLNLVRPVDFAVVDGIVGMEGTGPIVGEPVALDLVFAGNNAVAVDRACLWATMLPQIGVQHLNYATVLGLGPLNMWQVQLAGDSFTRRFFAWPAGLPPIVQYPTASPPAFPANRRTWITYRVNLPCETRVEIIQTSEESPEETLVRTLHDWQNRPGGEEMLIWNGRDDQGEKVAPGGYTMRVQARHSAAGTIAYATGRVQVI